MNYYNVMANYNQWMNQKFYDICADITDLECKSDRGAFFKLIDGTINHILITIADNQLHRSTKWATILA